MLLMLLVTCWKGQNALLMMGCRAMHRLAQALAWPLHDAVFKSLKRHLQPSSQQHAMFGAGACFRLDGIVGNMSIAVSA